MRRIYRFMPVVLIVLLAIANTSIASQSIARALQSIAFHSISGTVTYVGPKTGTIYILALKYADRGSLRLIQCKDRPLEDAGIVGYTAIEGPGPYSISGLPDEKYIVWAWMDVNNDEDVDFYKFAEPTGWYQTPDRLKWASVVISGGDVTDINLQLLTPTPFPEEEQTITYKQGGGVLKDVKGKKVLYLWGTPEERGYAQGYLVGPQIRDWIEYVCIEYFAGSISYYKNDVMYHVANRYKWTADDDAENNAILKGMRDSGTNMWIPLLGREVTINDLRAIQAYGEWWCSSVSVWGPGTQNSELKGGLIHGRNMDGETDLRKVTVNDALIFAIEPSDPNRKRRVCVDWPGFIGTYSGMNEDGLIGTSNAGDAEFNWEPTDFYPMTLIFREYLERGDAANAVASVESIIRSYSCSAGGPGVGGEIMHISSPYYEGQEASPSAIGEADSYAFVIRYPSELPYPTQQYCIVTTNTMYKLQATPTHTPRDFGLCWRYNAISNKLKEFFDAGETIDTAKMRVLIQQAEHNTTEYAVIFRPNEMTFDVAYEDLISKNLNAGYCNFTTFYFDELFSPLATGHGMMPVEDHQLVRGPAELYKIQNTKMELVITYNGENYYRVWDIVSHRESPRTEMFLCYNADWGYLIVRARAQHVIAHGPKTLFS
jgi:hypothetical protein